MENLQQLWMNLSLTRRFILVGASLGMFLAVIAIAVLGQKGPSSLLYAGLDSQSAGSVVAALDQAAIPYEVKGDGIYVASDLRDSLRMQLAADGLPNSTGVGYELLDGLTGFGTTSQMFDVAYLRAKEGELARTVMTMPQVKSARVHLAQVATDGYLRGRKMSASITVTTIGGVFGPEKASALRHLIASAVGGMSAQDVSVIDASSGLIPLEADQDDLLGDSRAAEIKRNVERLLFARVGHGNAVVEVAVEINRDREAISEKTFDPKSKVAISAENEKRSETATNPDPSVTVASNLPEGDGANNAGKSESTEARERVNYEVSQLQRELMKEPGAIRKLQVAVLVDGERLAGADGKIVWTPRSAEELEDLRALVASAAGIEEARGDIVTLRSMQFQAAPLLPASDAPLVAPFLSPADVMTLMQWAVLAALVLIIVIFVVRPILVARKAEVVGARLDESGSVEKMAVPPTFALPSNEDFALPQMAVLDFDENGYSGSDGAAKVDPVARLRELMARRQTESIEILRSWMEREREKS